MYFVKTPGFLKKICSKALWDLYTRDPILFLTFDDGPVPEVTPWVLDTLREFNASATFFCVGENVAKHPHIFERIKQEGHSVGNHTYNHLDGWKTRTADYIENIRRCVEIDSGLFRPPYGHLTLNQYRMLSENYRIIMWDVLSTDFDQHVDGRTCFERVVRHAKKGSIIVFHDSIKAAERLRYCLPKVLGHFRKQGFSFRSIT
jgi:peptidoglycan-N-acetylglucosamine deacetylase